VLGRAASAHSAVSMVRAHTARLVAVFWSLVELVSESTASGTGNTIGRNLLMVMFLGTGQKLFLSLSLRLSS
jgi:hypothetical protein